MLCPDGALTSPMWFVLVHKSDKWCLFKLLLRSDVVNTYLRAHTHKKWGKLTCRSIFSCPHWGLATKRSNQSERFQSAIPDSRHLFMPLSSRARVTVLIESIADKPSTSCMSVCFSARPRPLRGHRPQQARNQVSKRNSCTDISVVIELWVRVCVWARERQEWNDYCVFCKQTLFTYLGGVTGL